MAGPRVWLAGRPCTRPSDVAVVLDDQQREWAHGEDGRFHTHDGRHHQDWAELHARTDLVEIKEVTA